MYPYSFSLPPWYTGQRLNFIHSGAAAFSIHDIPSHFPPVFHVPVISVPMPAQQKAAAYEPDKKHNKNIENTSCEYPAVPDRAKWEPGPKAQIPVGQPLSHNRIPARHNNNRPAALHAGYTDTQIGINGFSSFAFGK